MEVLVQKGIKASWLGDMEGEGEGTQMLYLEQAVASSENQGMEAQLREKGHTWVNVLVKDPGTWDTETWMAWRDYRSPHWEDVGYKQNCLHGDSMVSCRNILCGPGRSSGPFSPHLYCSTHSGGSLCSETVLSSALHRIDSNKISSGNILCICYFQWV